MNASLLLRRAQRLERFFCGLDEAHGRDGTGNAAYIVQQAQNYLTALRRIARADDEKWVQPEWLPDGSQKETPASELFLVHASSELSRILAIALRECIAHGWDFDTLLADGVEYEEAVRADIEAGRRPANSHKGAHLIER